MSYEGCSCADGMHEAFPDRTGGLNQTQIRALRAGDKIRVILKDHPNPGWAHGREYVVNHIYSREEHYAAAITKVPPDVAAFFFANDHDIPRWLAFEAHMIELVSPKEKE